MLVFINAAYARDNFFSTENIIKLRMRLIHQCGLYSGFYGNFFFFIFLSFRPFFFNIGVIQLTSCVSAFNIILIDLKDIAS